MVTHSSILTWRIPQTEEPGRLQSIGVTKSRTRLSHFHFHPQVRGFVIQKQKEMPTGVKTKPILGCHTLKQTQSLISKHFTVLEKLQGIK